MTDILPAKLKTSRARCQPNSGQTRIDNISVFLLTWSDSEGIPFVIQEAICAGISCLSNDLPGPAAFLGLGSLSTVDEKPVVAVLEILADPRPRAELHSKSLRDPKSCSQKGAQKRNLQIFTNILRLAVINPACPWIPRVHLTISASTDFSYVAIHASADHTSS